MNKWTTWWARAQRGMGLLTKPYSNKIDIIIHDLPECQSIRFQFGTAYDTQSVMIKNAYCYGEGSQKTYPITFHGQITYKILPKNIIVSDDIDMKYLSQRTLHLVYEIETQNNYQCASGFELQSYDYLTSQNPYVYLLRSIEIFGSSLQGCICAFGDSITEQGYWSTPLTKMLKQKGYAFLQLGISGNRLLRELENVHIKNNVSQMELEPRMYTNIPLEKQCFGKAGMKRFQEDVLTCHNIVGVIIAIGVNDLYQPGTFCANIQELPSVDDMVKGYQSLHDQTATIPTWVLGMTPFLGAEGSTVDKEDIRRHINMLLEEHFQNYISFDELLLNEKGQIKSQYHNGDYLHPNQIAGEIMAQLIMKEMEV